MVRNMGQILKIFRQKIQDKYQINLDGTFNQKLLLGKMCPNQSIFIRATFNIKDLHYQWLLFNKCPPNTKANLKVGSSPGLVWVWVIS